MFSERIFSPSPTVRSSRVPLYLRGIGQDDSLLPGFDASGDFSVLNMPTGSEFIAPTDTTLPDQYAISPDGTVAQNLSTGEVYDISSGNLYSPSGAIISSDAQQEAAYQVAQQGGSAAQQAAASSAVKAGATSAQVAAAVANALKTVTTAVATPAPKVALPAASSLSTMLAKSSIISGVPDVAIYGIGLVALLALTGKRR